MEDIHNFILSVDWQRYFFFVIDFVGAIVIIYVVVNFFRVLILETKINKLEDEKINKITEIRNQPITLNQVKGQSEKKDRDFEEKIQPLKRKRKFILEKLPFFNFFK